MWVQMGAASSMGMPRMGLPLLMHMRVFRDRGLGWATWRPVAGFWGQLPAVSLTGCWLASQVMRLSVPTGAARRPSRSPWAPALG